MIQIFKAPSFLAQYILMCSASNPPFLLCYHRFKKAFSFSLTSNEIMIIYMEKRSVGWLKNLRLVIRVDQISGVIENHTSYISLYIFIFVLFTHTNIDKFKGKTTFQYNPLNSGISHSKTAFFLKAPWNSCSTIFNKL